MSNGTLPGGGGRTNDLHPGNAKRLSDSLNDFNLTMQHALRYNIYSELEKLAKEEAGILPEFSVAEMYDYLMDSDDEFLNWLFPFCAIRLTKENLGHLHTWILTAFRKSLETEPVNGKFEVTIEEHAK